MKRTPIPHQRAERIVAAVIDRPGMSRDQIADLLGLSIRLVRVGLLIAKERGDIGGAYIAEGCVGWFPADQVPAAKAAAAERVKASRAARRKREMDRRAGRVPKPSAAVHVDPGDVPITRRRVDVGAPLPFKLRAVRSVFEWGQA